MNALRKFSDKKAYNLYGREKMRITYLIKEDSVAFSQASSVFEHLSMCNIFEQQLNWFPKVDRTNVNITQVHQSHLQYVCTNNCVRSSIVVCTVD